MTVALDDDPAVATQGNVLLDHLKGRISNIHIPGPRPDIYIFSTPRSGSTFLMELLGAQPGMRVFDEPLNLHKRIICKELGVRTWEQATVMADRKRVYGRYFRRLAGNGVPAMSLPFYWPDSRFITRRNTFKILHGGEDMIPWFQDTFGGRIVLLLRHPIPTILSHRRYPRLAYFLRQPEMRARFEPEQVAFAEETIAGDDRYAQGIVNWCLQNALALGPDRRDDWTVVSYEDLTIHPRTSVDWLTERLDLEPVDDGELDRLVSKPSGSTVQSDSATKEFFAQLDSGQDRTYLIDKWRERVSPEQERLTFEILERMGIDYYEPGNLFPRDAYRLPGVPLSDPGVAS